MRAAAAAAAHGRALGGIKGPPVQCRVVGEEGCSPGRPPTGLGTFFLLFFFYFIFVNPTFYDALCRRLRSAESLASHKNRQSTRLSSQVAYAAGNGRFLGVPVSRLVRFGSCLSHNQR